MNTKFFPEKIEGERIVLRRHSPALAQTMFSYVDSDRARLRIYLPWVDAIKTLEDESKFIEFASESWNNFTMFDFGIFRKSDDVYMGNVGIHSIAWKSEVCEIGYWILGKFEGMGYVSEAVCALEKAAFALGFERVEIRCSSINFKSAAVPMRCGYTMEGCLRSNGSVNGKRVNTFVFSKIRGDN